MSLWQLSKEFGCGYLSEPICFVITGQNFSGGAAWWAKSKWSIEKAFVIAMKIYVIWKKKGICTKFITSTFESKSESDVNILCLLFQLSDIQVGLQVL